MAASSGSVTADGRMRLLGTSTTNQSVEDMHNLNIHDEFDPFDAYAETEKNEPTMVDGTLAAPPQNEWYHGRMDRMTAEMRLNGARVGSYLIRESERKPGSYVLSYLGIKGFQHFRITALCGDYYVGGRQFPSLAELIGYYTHVSNILKNERLLYPVPPPEPLIDDRKKVVAVLPYTKVPDTDELSFSAGEVFVVHNELGDGWLWVTSQRTGESGIVIDDLVKSIDKDTDINEGKIWYHGNVSKEVAAELLLKEGDVGSYLVRNSDKNPGDYSLSFRGPTTIQRFRIQKQQHHYMMGGRTYHSLDAIIDHYKNEEIVNGYKLGAPVVPKNLKMNRINPDSTVNYEDIRRRRSSGMVIMTGTGDRIARQGFLSKKSSKHKKWKTYFFVLNSTEQHLYYFENDKRTKPKGLIDLGYGSVYMVHESLFNRPNCFQIVVRAMSDVEVFYLNAETPQLAQTWTQVLRSCCTRASWTQTTRAKSSGIKQLKSLSLHILEAHKIPSRQISHPYCVISLNNIKVARTPIQVAPDPVWSEEFVFDDFPDDIDSFTIDIFNGAKRAKPIPLCRTTLLLVQLPNGVVVDQWYTLIALTSQGRGEMGSIRTRAQFLQETLMPLEEYRSLQELVLCDSDYHFIYALEDACCKDRSNLASILLDIFRHQQKEVELLKKLNSREIEKEEEKSTLFRSNTLATTLMDKYMKITAQEFVQHALHDVIIKIMESKHSCELNPLKVEKGDDVSENCEYLLEFLKEIIESIFASGTMCPPALRYLCWCLKQDVRQKWPDDPNITARAIGGFIFLRLICPAILNPRLFNIVTEAASPMASRTLMIVAKAIQNLANQVEFGTNYKEAYMVVINPYIVINKGRMCHFLNELATVTECPPPGEVPPIDLARQLAALHQLCVTYIKELQQLSVVQPSLKKLLAVTEMLTHNRNQYMGRSTTLV
ncbi:ras GTPase-activating protein 1-like [Acanthaster planci]|uniref:Ras GTPase-activating protein 1-like n=1 Tax=Acanthaster planci TaxID=133434 RepID=A0A8B7ZLN8_ACAPL|nr:ras GTPase-activating protein 1-like [Acanthaster planci]XP_022105977.1 ras GTPase-activating protein 1-like [Acanthaster planci]